MIEEKKKIFFGRSKSRALSKSKKFFYVNHKNDFLVNFEQIKLVKDKNFILEIGFGLGENLLFQATKYPENYFIGIDPFINGVANVVQKAKELNLNNISILDTPAQKVLDNFSDNLFSKVFVLFPDPWMKNKQKKRRLLNYLFLEKILKKMRTKSTLIFATDDQDYFNFVIKEVSLLRKKIDTFKYSLGNKHPIADTKYSNKANKLKKDIYFLNLDK
ncbi:MAG: tRNA (guanosine(46)-N7)-methyltransferase TrmB [Candidatus Fonsibacter ubiquis]|nr:tRNA (guanosine(46)-N7)-methyltransferase TrmB [Candidatus Fonsibacter ubiquis]NCU54018.1 tRNA (guanosine(46)-N7)-methyltransferase TrmB [Candidatus Fonsibacter ubiquis]NCU75064.1 tRNA (guanosine(46)-N7)-methyltransferase TrmB [Candidatus Fonsibacter ubiquis]